MNELPFGPSPLLLSEQDEEYYANFTFDGEPHGPRTELWTAYIPHDESAKLDDSPYSEIHFIAGTNVWIRCSFKQWKQAETFVILVYKKTGNANWENHDSVFHNFNADFRINPADVKNVAYIFEVVTNTGKSIARTPIVRPFTERWFREKLKKEGMQPVKNKLVGKFTCETVYLHGVIKKLSKQNELFLEQIEQLKHENSLIKEENKILHKQTEYWENLFQQFNGALSPSVDSTFSSMEETNPNFFDLRSSPSPNSFQTISPFGTSGSSPPNPNPTPSPQASSSPSIPFEFIPDTSPMTPNQFLSSETLDFPLSASTIADSDVILGSLRSLEEEESEESDGTSEFTLKKKQITDNRRDSSPPHSVPSPPRSFPSPRAAATSFTVQSSDNDPSRRRSIASPSRKAIAPPSAPPPAPSVPAPAKLSVSPSPFRGSNAPPSRGRPVQAFVGKPRSEESKAMPSKDKEKKKAKPENKKSGALISELEEKQKLTTSKSKSSLKRGSSVEKLTEGVNSMQIEESKSEMEKMIEAQQKLSKLLQNKPLHHQVLFQLMGGDEKIVDSQNLSRRDFLRDGNVIFKENDSLGIRIVNNHHLPIYVYLHICDPVGKVVDIYLNPEEGGYVRIDPSPSSNNAFKAMLGCFSLPETFREDLGLFVLKLIASTKQPVKNQTTEHSIIIENRFFIQRNINAIPSKAKQTPAVIEDLSNLLPESIQLGSVYPQDHWQSILSKTHSLSSFTS